MNGFTKTSTAATLLAMTVMLVSATVTAAEDEHAGHHPQGTAAPAAGNTPPAPTAAMQAEMGDRMKKMQAQMAAIGKATDPKERAKLLDEHMQSMQSMMQEMKKSGGGMMMGEGGKPMQGKEAAGGMGMMQMQMMQMMMDQMMQHQKAMEGATK
jgi:hypothetical protein